ncbi:uncharacterized protein JN550_000424 [Neoarthrinium moseri]|uniref:uncharacterized protein n=1 Tax=Neoarthrinium moseri TaxID=1658444 RepID=UPI001FDE5817|nr:uncharacterized protein JN550_000424 [Neoarthrinium moseri]KAI1878242.1 hypothetical protein JN550_000424 [Neoarthrinium moseri]
MFISCPRRNGLQRSPNQLATTLQHRTKFQQHQARLLEQHRSLDLGTQQCSQSGRVLNQASQVFKQHRGLDVNLDYLPNSTPKVREHSATSGPTETTSTSSTASSSSETNSTSTSTTSTTVVSSTMTSSTTTSTSPTATNVVQNPGFEDNGGTTGLCNVHHFVAGFADVFTLALSCTPGFVVSLTVGVDNFVVTPV